MHPEQRLSAPFFFNDIYQICSILNFEWPFNFWGNLLLLVQWVTGKKLGSESLGLLKDSWLISIWANRLFVFFILNTYINNYIRWLHVFFAAVLKLLQVHVKLVTIPVYAE